MTQWTAAFDHAQTVDWTTPGLLHLEQDLPEKTPATMSFPEPAGVAAADLDGDQDLDLIAASFAGHQVAWFENDGTGHGWTAHIITDGFQEAVAVCAYDIDGDQDLDVAAAAEAAHEVAWFENDGTGGTWSKHVVTGAVNGPFCVCAADFDGDVDPDLCSAIFYAGDILWWENQDGQGTSWVQHEVDTGVPGAWWAVACDLDGDEDVDVVGAAFSAGDLCWWENDGAGGTWDKHLIDSAFPNPVSVRVAKIGADDHWDIVSISYGGAVAWWENDGTNLGWNKHTIAPSLAQPFGLRVADLDADGDQDVITNEREGDRVLWLENVAGDGTLWLDHTVDSTGDGPNDVLAADINGDARPDVIASHSFDHSVAWYDRTQAYLPAGTLESSILDPGDAFGAWESIEWVADCPSGTEVTVAVRASHDVQTMGSWVPVSSSGDDLSAYIPGDARYIQYRVSLSTAQAEATPAVEEVAVSWLGAAHVPPGDAAQEGCFWLRPALPNPSSQTESATIHFGLPHPSRVDLAIFSVEGRRIQGLAQGLYPTGEFQATVQGLERGLYLCRLVAGPFTQTRKLIVE